MYLAMSAWSVSGVPSLTSLLSNSLYLLPLDVQLPVQDLGMLLPASP